MTTRDLRGLRAEYLFPLSRVCGLAPPEVDGLDLIDFANLTDSIDHWLKIELQLMMRR
jgi:hypothetical protein